MKTSHKYYHHKTPPCAVSLSVSLSRFEHEIKTMPSSFFPTCLFETAKSKWKKERKIYNRKNNFLKASTAAVSV